MRGGCDRRGVAPRTHKPAAAASAHARARSFRRQEATHGGDVCTQAPRPETDTGPFDRVIAAPASAGDHAATWGRAPPAAEWDPAAPEPRHSGHPCRIDCRAAGFPAHSAPSAMGSAAGASGNRAARGPACIRNRAGGHPRRKRTPARISARRGAGTLPFGAARPAHRKAVEWGTGAASGNLPLAAGRRAAMRQPDDGTSSGGPTGSGSSSPPCRRRAGSSTRPFPACRGLARSRPPDERGNG